MVKEHPLGIRLEPEEREALQKAAEMDERALSALGRKIIVDWLRAKGWLKKVKK